jgi:hypothetical protein
MTKFGFFMWCIWGCVLLSVGSIILIPIAMIVLPLALIAVLAYIIY